MTPEQIQKHLERRVPGFVPTGPPERLDGGLLNYVWRAPGRPEPVIVKVAPPHIATNPEVPLDPERILFEARSLAELRPGGQLEPVSSQDVRPPRLIDFDEQRHTLIMEDLGTDLELGTWLHRGQGDAGAAGRRLGQFIGALHARTQGDDAIAQAFDNCAIQETRYAVQYCAIGALCSKAGLPDVDVLGQRAEALGERFLQPGRCLIMGDLWPSSVLIKEGALRVIDWEFSHYGSPAQDVGHLAAHLWMHAHRAPSEKAAVRSQACWQAFLEAYRAALGAVAETLWTPAVLDEAARHVGCEILVRTVGAFQNGYLYEGLPPEASDVRDANEVAATHLRAPDQVDTFAVLARPR